LRLAILSLVFGTVVLGASIAAGRWLDLREPWRLSILPVICAVFTFWQWRRWRNCAQESRREAKILTEALSSLGYETANAVNAAKANLEGFRREGPAPAASEHLDEVGRSLDRVSTVLEIARDPSAWYEKKHGAASRSQTTRR